MICSLFACSSETFLTRDRQNTITQGERGPTGLGGVQGEPGLSGDPGPVGVNCYDEIGDVNEDGALTAADCLEAIRREMLESGQGNALQCQTLQTQELTDGVHVLSCPDGTTLVSANCPGVDRYGYPVVAAEEGDPPNTARCRCSSQCSHTTLMIRCCTHALPF
ncbi:MAG: hypothetical protein OSB21_06830 [Myxococcota bacterium]|nr:hypothetical protein [Myxococcota bacterium]